MTPTLWEDLKRRRVFRVAAGYVAISFALMEGADLVLPRLGLPDRVITWLVVLVVLAFPFVLMAAWMFDLSSGRLIRTRTAVSSASESALESGPDLAAGETTRGDGVPAATGGRPLRLALLVLMSIGFAALAWMWLPRVPALRTAEVDPDALVVLPFEVRGRAEDAYLREGLVDLFSTRLDGVGTLRVVDPHTTLAALRGGERSLSREEALMTAVDLEAARALQGSIVRAGDRWQLNAVVYGPGPDHQIRADVEGSGDDLIGLVDRLAAELVSQGLLTGNQTIGSLEGRLTTSNEALRLFLNGVSAFRRGAGSDETFAPLARAVALDSTFALAAYWAGYVAAYEESGDPLPFLELATRHRESLGRRDRMRLAAALAGAEGRHRDAILRYRALIDRFPDDLAGWLQLAEQLAHTGQFTGHTLADARPVYERTIELDPGLVPSFYHLAQIGGLQADSAALRVWATGLAERGIDSVWLADLDMVRGLVAGDSALARRGFELFRTLESELPPATIGGSTGILMGAVVAHAPGPTRDLLWEFGRRASTDTTRAVAARWIAKLEAASGRFAEAERALRDQASELGTLLPQDLAWIALHPAATDVRRRAALQNLRTIDPPAHTGEAAARHYLIGRLALVLGETGTFGSARDSLAGFHSDQAEIAAFAADLAHELEAVRLLASGDAEAGLDALLRAGYWERRRAWHGFAEPTYFDERLPRREAMFLRAELLRTAGRDSAAAQWYRVVADGPFHRAPAWIRLAELRARAGDREAASQLLAAVEYLWQDGDPEAREWLVSQDVLGNR